LNSGKCEVLCAQSITGCRMTSEIIPKPATKPETQRFRLPLSSSGAEPFQGSAQ